LKHSYNQFVFACSQTTYCCSPYQGVLPGGYTDRPSNYSCCNDPSQVFDAGPANYLALRKDFTTSLFTATATGGVASSSTTSRSTSAPTGSLAAGSNSNSASTESSPSSSSTSDQLSAGAKAGIGIGAALVAVIALALAAWLTMKYRHQKKASTPLIAQPGHGGSEEIKPSTGPYEASAWQVQQQAQGQKFPGMQTAHEIGPGAQVGRSELSEEGGRRELP
jgi:hypothetical protein